MRSRVYETVERPSVRLSHRSTAAAACGGFAAKRHAGRKYLTIAGAGIQQQRGRCTGPQHGAQQQMRSVPCWQPRDKAEHRLALFMNASPGQNLISIIVISVKVAASALSVGLTLIPTNRLINKAPIGERCIVMSIPANNSGPGAKSDVYDCITNCYLQRSAFRLRYAHHQAIGCDIVS